jgi:hypothetical protein
MSLASLVSLIFPTVYADSPVEEPKEQKEATEGNEDSERSVTVASEVLENSTEDSEASTGDEEEDEPQDVCCLLLCMLYLTRL